jgi:hypothetical protein
VCQSLSLEISEPRSKGKSWEEKEKATVQFLQNNNGVLHKY